MRSIFIALSLACCAILASCVVADTLPPANLTSALATTDAQADSTASDAEQTASIQADGQTADGQSVVAEGSADDSEVTETPQTATASAAPAETTGDAEAETKTASTSGLPTPDASSAATQAETTTAAATVEGTATDAASPTAATALAAAPKRSANPFAAFLKSQGRNTRPKANVGVNRQFAGTRRTKAVRKPSRNRKVASLTVRRSNSSAAQRGSAGALPGVKIKNIFSIDEEEDAERDIAGGDAKQLASLTNMARRGSHGLILQRPGVKVGCFPPNLLRILKRVERKFGRTPIVTSGYRSASYNRKIRGAKKSLHVRCLAADIQVQGVSKWTLAKYLRTLPGRGGVGTYCHTKSVHIDIGTKRDWNRRCRRKRRA